jgi:hypothetical protein
VEKAGLIYGLIFDDPFKANYAEEFYFAINRNVFGMNKSESLAQRS